jgi:hypothetical protein
MLEALKEWIVSCAPDERQQLLAVRLQREVFGSASFGKLKRLL